MSIGWKIFSTVRYIICSPFVVLIMTATAPLTLFLKWNGAWVLYVANKENCSLSKARKLLKEDDRYKLIADSDFEMPNPASLDVQTSGIKFSNSSPSSTHSSFTEFDKYQTSPAYSNLNYNVYHNNNNN
jgi:hypothetical protein